MNKAGQESEWGMINGSYYEKRLEGPASAVVAADDYVFYGRRVGGR